MACPQFEAETEEDTKNPPLWKTRWFWCRFMPGVLTAILLTIAIIMVIFYRSLTAVYFEVCPGHNSMPCYIFSSSRGSMQLAGWKAC